MLFLSYYPLKQGLKRISLADPLLGMTRFLSYYPLKQGLKPGQAIDHKPELVIFILLSIKTRIETICFLSLAFIRLNFYPTIH